MWPAELKEIINSFIMHPPAFGVLKQQQLNQPRENIEQNVAKLHLWVCSLGENVYKSFTMKHFAKTTTVWSLSARGQCTRSAQSF